MQRVIHTLTRWPFLTSLALLLLNDFWLKSQYPGLVTGKLSDFAGIAMIALPCLAAFPRRVRTIYAAIAVAFLWWKSPLSGAFISFANEVLPFDIARVVDYSDLLALLVLPFCSVATRDARAEPGRLRRALAIPIGAVAIFATAATSMPPPPYSQLTVRTIDPAVSLDRTATADAIESVMKTHRLDCIECAQRERKGAYNGRDVGVRYYFPAPNSVYFEISWYNGSFGNGEKRLAVRVKEALKEEFTARFRGLEAVEPLRDPFRYARPPCIDEAPPTPHCTATGQDASTGAPL
jgi:hypothetical protein